MPDLEKQVSLLTKAITQLVELQSAQPALTKRQLLLQELSQQPATLGDLMSLQQPQSNGFNVSDMFKGMLNTYAEIMPMQMQFQMLQSLPSMFNQATLMRR